MENIESIEFKRPRGRPRKYLTDDERLEAKRKQASEAFHRNAPLDKETHRVGRPPKYMDRDTRINIANILRNSKKWTEKIFANASMEEDKYLKRFYEKAEIVPMDEYHKECLLKVRCGEIDFNTMRNLIIIHLQSKPNNDE